MDDDINTRNAAWLKAAFGHDFYVMSTTEVGHALGISSSRVEQIERKAIAKLRAYCEQRGISAEDALDLLRRRDPPVGDARRGA